MRPLRAPALLLALLAVGAPAAARADTVESCVRPSERGQVLLDQRRLLEARAEFVRCAAEACPVALQRECVRWLDEVRARLPTVAVSARDADGRDLVDVRVLVDGKLLAERLDGAAVAVDPGEHVFRYEPRGAAPIEERVLVREGEANRLLTVHVPRAVAPASTATARAPLAEAPREPARPVPAASIVLGGVSLLAAGAFAFFAASAKSSLDDLRSGCGRTRSCATSDVDGVRRDLVVANASLGVGVLALAAAVWIFLQRPSRAPAHAAGLALDLP